MNRRDLLAGIGGLSTAGIAGCTGLLESESTPTEVTTSEAMQVQQTTELQTPTATQTPPSNPRDFGRGFLLDAFRIALVRSGIRPYDLSLDSGSVLLNYDTTSAITADEVYTASLLTEFLTIAGVFYRELLRQGFETDKLQIWVRRDDINKVYDMRSEWVRDWANVRITDAQFLTHVTRSVQNVGN